MGTFFRNGYWTWDNENECLKFNSRDETEKVKAARGTSGIISSAPVVTISSKIKFRDVVDKLEQIQFRRHFQRQCSLNEPDVVTIQDVKDVVLFTARLDDLSVEFINLLHSPTTDRFLRALIIYLQSYFQVYNDMLQYKKDNKRKIWQPIVEEHENIARNDLADLRSVVAKEYLAIISGVNDMKRFYHFKKKIRTSLSDRDKTLFESLMSIASRVVWVALRRKRLPLIDVEINRIFRSRHFNSAYRRHPSLGKVQEKPILRGTSDLKQRKYLQHSPALNEILKTAHDHRMLAIGVVQIEPTDDRLQYLEAAYMAPEELLPELGVTVGILGLPRNKFDDMLKVTTGTVELPLFKLPPKSIHKDESMPKEFPKKPYCKYEETEQTRVARERQRRIWGKLVHRKDLMEAIMEQADVKLNPSKSVTSLKRSSISMKRSSVRFRVDSQDISLFSF